MNKQKRLNRQRGRRLGHVRRILRSGSRPRLAVFRSNKHIAAQIIDDSTGRTLAAASTHQPAVREGLRSTSDCAAAQRVGSVLAERAKDAGLDRVALDRGRYKYHGRVAALADAARKGGLDF